MAVLSRLAWGFTLLLGVIPVRLSAGAQYTTETFSAGASGWQGTTEFATGSWTYTGGVVRLTFNDTSFVVIPDVGSLSNQVTASGGAFTGNYVGAGIDLIGFRFLSNTDMPSSVRLHLVGPTSEYRRIFYPNQTGVWVTLAASLAGAAEGGWVRVGGAGQDFDQVRQQVRYVAIKVDRAGTTLRHYFIDDIFLDRLPATQQLALSTNGLLQAQVNYLRTGSYYQVEAAPEVTGTWNLVQAWTATNRLQALELTNGAFRRFWRVNLPVP